MNNLQTKICAILYYRRDQYDLLREVSIDKETFSISYEQMKVITELKHREMENKGFKVVKINVDIEEFVEWATSLNVIITSESRTKFAMKKLKEMLFNKSLAI